MSTARVETNARSELATFLRAMFIVPMAQIRIFDLPYQLYVFEVFHASRLNRWSHFVGIPASLAALYLLLSPIPYASAVALAVVVGIQVGICLSTGLRALIPVVLSAHGAIWLIALHWLNRFVVFGGAWWAHPAFHVLAWPALQYATHIFERDLPPPWSGNDQWIPTLTFVRTATLRQVVKAVAYSPLHAVVEVISSHRNSFILLLLALERLGYRPAPVVTMRRWIDAECGRVARVVEYDEFQRKWSAGAAGDGTLAA